MAVKVRQTAAIGASQYGPSETADETPAIGIETHRVANCDYSLYGNTEITVA